MSAVVQQRGAFHTKPNKKDGYRQLNVRQLSSLRPWDHRGKCYMDRMRIQCLSNASQHVPIYLQPFLKYSVLLVENCDILTPHLCLAAPQAVTPSEFREDLGIHKTRMNGLSCGEESLTIYSAVLIQCQLARRFLVVTSYHSRNYGHDLSAFI